MLKMIKNLREIHKQYKSIPFIFRERDYVQLVRSEMNEVRRLLFAFRVRSEQDIAEENRLKEVEEKKAFELDQKVQYQRMLHDRKGLPFNEEEFKRLEKEKEESEPSEEEDQEEVRRRTLSPLRIVP